MFHELEPLLWICGAMLMLTGVLLNPLFDSGFVKFLVLQKQSSSFRYHYIMWIWIEKQGPNPLHH